LTTDRYRKQLALEGDALLGRVAKARKLYGDLQRVADSERLTRTQAQP